MMKWFLLPKSNPFLSGTYQYHANAFAQQVHSIAFELNLIIFYSQAGANIFVGALEPVVGEFCLAYLLAGLKSYDASGLSKNNEQLLR